MSQQPTPAHEREQTTQHQPMNDLYDWYREMRETQPVAYDAERHAWNLFRYDDIQRVLTDYSTFSSEMARLAPPEQRNGVASLIFSDPPQHRKLRALVTQAFTPQAVAALEPRIREIVNEQLDAVGPAGRMELIGDLAEPLPVIVIAELLGIPTERRADFRRWSDAIVTAGGDDVGGMASGAMSGRSEFEELRQYLLEVIEQRRARPQDDLISHLLRAQVDGVALTEDELLTFCTLLLVAGNETTTHLLSNAMLCFDEHPEVWAQLRANPALVPAAIEEVLRYRSPVRAVFRLAAQETTVGGETIPAGSLVMAWVASAGRDAAQFPNPDRFEITRTPNRHLSFGHGVHFCIGAPLSRLEARVALEIMLRRFAELRIAPDQPVELLALPTLNGVKRLPVVFTPAS